MMELGPWNGECTPREQIFKAVILCLWKKTAESNQIEKYRAGAGSFHALSWRLVDKCGGAAEQSRGIFVACFLRHNTMTP